LVELQGASVLGDDTSRGVVEAVTPYRVDLDRDFQVDALWRREMRNYLLIQTVQVMAEAFGV
jgi:hypothetical protein